MIRAFDSHSFAPASPHPRPRHTHPALNLKLDQWSNVAVVKLDRAWHAAHEQTRQQTRQRGSRRRTLYTDRRKGALRLGTRRVRDVPPSVPVSLAHGSRVLAPGGERQHYPKATSPHARRAGPPPT